MASSRRPAAQAPVQPPKVQARQATRPAKDDLLASVHLRLHLGPEIALGPGKADLLEGIVATGSIAAAGRRLGMSYKRAWILIDTMNACFRTPLVAVAKGGRAGGGATLTPLGARVLTAYRRVQKRAAQSVRAEVAELRRFLLRAPRRTPKQP